LPPIAEVPPAPPGEPFGPPDSELHAGNASARSVAVLAEKRMPSECPGEALPITFERVRRIAASTPLGVECVFGPFR
jgi:hypothetical protein